MKNTTKQKKKNSFEIKKDVKTYFVLYVEEWIVEILAETSEEAEKKALELGYAENRVLEGSKVESIWEKGK